MRHAVGVNLGSNLVVAYGHACIAIGLARRNHVCEGIAFGFGLVYEQAVCSTLYFTVVSYLDVGLLSLYWVRIRVWVWVWVWIRVWIRLRVRCNLGIVIVVRECDVGLVAPYILLQSRVVNVRISVSLYLVYGIVAVYLLLAYGVVGSPSEEHVYGPLCVCRV